MIVATQTPNLQLTMPELNEKYSLTVVNDNTTKIDEAFGTVLRIGNIANNLLQSEAGQVLDARQGKLLNEALSALTLFVENNLSTVEYDENMGIWRRKISAATVDNNYDYSVAFRTQSQTKLEVSIGVKTDENLPTGTKTPSNPSLLTGRNAISFTVANNALGAGLVSYNASLNTVLWGLEGARDEYRNDGYITRRTSKIDVRGNTAPITWVDQNETYVRFKLTNLLTGTKVVDRVSALCDRFPVLYNETGLSSEYISQGNFEDVASIVVCISKMRLAPWSETFTATEKASAFASWLSSVVPKIVYELETPVVARDANANAAVNVLASEWIDKLTPRDTVVDTIYGVLSVIYPVTMIQEADEIRYNTDKTVDGELTRLGNIVDTHTDDISAIYTDIGTLSDTLNTSLNTIGDAITNAQIDAILAS